MNSIDVVRAGKAYKSYPRKSGRALEWMGFRDQHQKHWVLRDVTFGIGPGESVGIIGANGAGKSTLLKIIAGVTQPTEGSIHRSGRVAALLELGMGFHSEFTGRQNVFMAGQLQGMTPGQIAAHLDEIRAFADIGDYFDEPVRTYSSGMQVRLAFSVATAMRPDILIVDEALAVGDIFFQQKCFDRLAQYRDAGTTILFVSHAPATVVQLCERAIFLEQGRVRLDGTAREATDLYQASSLVKLDKRAEEISVANVEGQAAAGTISTPSVTLAGATLFDDSGKPTTVLIGDATARLEIRYTVHRELDDPHIGFKIRDRFGAVLFESNSYCMRQPIGPVAAGTQIIAAFEFPVSIAPGDYTITSGFANRGFGEGSFEEALAYTHGVLAFAVARTSRSITWSGLINLNPRFSVERRPA